MKMEAIRRRSGFGGVMPKVIMKASARESSNFMSYTFDSTKQRWILCGLTLMILWSGARWIAAQETPGKAATVEPSVDPEVAAASEEIGRALILRCLCMENTLHFDANGTLEEDASKKTDWTLAGMNVLKVERRGPDMMELDGVRVAARFTPDRKEFDRHVLTDETVKITVQTTPDTAKFQTALAAIFSQGIDRALQQSLPAYWRHYFDPQLAWPPDSLANTTIYSTASVNDNTVKPPAPIHRTLPEYTSAARNDRVQGAIILTLVVDGAGSTQRIAIAQPLGYGLDAQAARAAGKLRFTPCEKDGQPVACSMFLRQEFRLASVPQ